MCIHCLRAIELRSIEITNILESSLQEEEYRRKVSLSLVSYNTCQLLVKMISQGTELHDY